MWHGQAGVKSTDQPVFGIRAADAGYTLPVVVAGEKVLSNCLNPYEAELPECIGILIIITATEIGEMQFEDLMKDISSPWKIFGLLLSGKFRDHRLLLVDFDDTEFFQFIEHLLDGHLLSKTGGTQYFLNL